jgi:alcohol dehydrogenase class IV
MTAAQITQPRLIQGGAGAVGEIASVLRRIGGQRPLIVTDRYMVSSGTIDRVIKPLADAGISFDVFADTVPDPTTTVVEAGAAVLAAGGYDSIVALGGGSPIDTAKAMAVLAANGGRMRDYKVPNDIPKMGVPLVAIPTTAGTGAEVTRFTVITDVEHDEKMLIAGLPCVPAAALVDFELTLTMPRRLTADTGIDSLTHAIEAYVSRRANRTCMRPRHSLLARNPPCLRRAVRHARARR